MKVASSDYFRTSTAIPVHLAMGCGRPRGITGPRMALPPPDVPSEGQALSCIAPATQGPRVRPIYPPFFESTNKMGMTTAIHRLKFPLAN